MWNHVYSIVRLALAGLSFLWFMGAAAAGDNARTGDFPVRNWQAPTYWMPPQDAPGSAPPAVKGSGTLTRTAGTGALLAGSVTPLSGPLTFVAVTPCRLVDTRSWAGMPAPFGAPALVASAIRPFPVLSHPYCVLPAAAKALSLNLLAIPNGRLDWFSAWPGGYPYPGTSFLNSYSGDLVNNAVVIGVGVDGSINVRAGNPMDLIVDVNGYYIDLATPTKALGGVVNSNGSAQSLPQGSGSSRTAAGQYTVTFPPGTFPATSTPSPVVSPIGSIVNLLSASVLRFSDGSGALSVVWANDVTFSFVVAPN